MMSKRRDSKGDQEGQMEWEGKIQRETPVETEQEVAFQKQVTLHENRKNEGKWERSDPT